MQLITHEDTSGLKILTLVAVLLPPAVMIKKGGLRNVSHLALYLFFILIYLFIYLVSLVYESRPVGWFKSLVPPSSSSCSRW